MPIYSFQYGEYNVAEFLNNGQAVFEILERIILTHIPIVNLRLDPSC